MRRAFLLMAARFYATTIYSALINNRNIIYLPELDARGNAVTCGGWMLRFFM
jgi:hypothetical protein